MSDSRATVLVVDDSPEDRGVCRHYLAGVYNIREAELGGLALRLCQDAPPACILLDYRLPDYDGLAWLRSLHAQHGALAPPVIMLSGVGSEDVAVEVMKQGAQDYLIKGRLTAEILRRAVQHAIETAVLRRNLHIHRQHMQERDVRIQLALTAAQMRAWDLDVRTNTLVWVENFGPPAALEAGQPPGTLEAFLACVHAEDRDRVARAVADSLNHGIPCDVEYRVPMADGRVRWQAAKWQVVYDVSGQAARLVGISMDITARKQIDEALRASEERFRTLANVVPAIFWTAAPDGTITFANDQWFHYCGLTPEQNAQHWPELVLHPEDRERCLAQWSASLARGTPYEIEVRNRRYDGVYRWFLTRAMPVHDVAGRLIAWYGTTTDIHDRKCAEEVLQQAHHELERRVEERTVALQQAMDERQRLEREAQRVQHFALLGRLAAGVSHEIRNPLGAVFLQVDLLEEELRDPSPDSPTQIAESFQEIKTQLQRLEELVQDYLSLVRVANIQRTPQDFGAAVQSWAKEVHAQAATGGVTLRLEGLADLGQAVFHAGTLRRAISNLLQNAMDAMPQGGTLTLSGQGTATQVQLRVQDTGSGIPLALHEQIFEPLYTTKPGGTGLGLYIVQEILTAHEGHITVQSAAGRGTTFSITLPRTPHETASHAVGPVASISPHTVATPTSP